MRPQVRALLPAGVEGAECLGPCATPQLLPDEQPAVAKAVEKRKHEFATGRACARAALLAVGAAPLPLLHLPDRTVAWPAGFVGSITHTEGYAAALAAPLGIALGLGIDAELKHRVEPRLWKQIATPAELSWCEDASDENEALARATRLFSAKEAFYKAQYCVSRAWVGFHDVGITFDESTFQVELRVDVAGLAPQGTHYLGRHVTLGAHVITTLTLLKS